MPELTRQKFSFPGIDWEDLPILRKETRSVGKVKELIKKILHFSGRDQEELAQPRNGAGRLKPSREGFRKI